MPVEGAEEDVPESYEESANRIIAELNDCINWDTIADLVIQFEGRKKDGVYVGRSDVEH